MFSPSHILRRFPTGNDLHSLCLTAFPSFHTAMMTIKRIPTTAPIIDPAMTPAPAEPFPEDGDSLAT